MDTTKPRTTITFEGLYNVDSHYEFDTDCVMVVPWIRWNDSAGNDGEIDTMVEDAIIDMDLGIKNKSEEPWRMPKEQLLKEFEEAKKNGRSGKPGRQWVYWKRTIEFGDELNHFETLESVGG